MTKLPILPPSELDGRWFTDLLQANNVDAVVRGASRKNVGTGQIGDSVRFVLDYERDAPNAPRSLVGKFPSSDPTSRGTGVMLQNYLREIRFYQELAPRARITLPTCWRADINAETQDFVLIMEDLAPAEQGDQLKGVTLAQAKLVLEEAAKLHAAFWNDDYLETLTYVSGSKAAEAARPGVGGDMVAGLWGAFKQRYGARLWKDSKAIGDELCSRFADQANLHPGPRCLTHNDFRPDNMMFATAAGGRPFTMLDWQSFAYGTGAVDVAYFLAGALTPEERRANEAALLKHYHDALTREGVSGYSMDALKEDYRTGAFLLFFTAFFASVVVVQTPRGDDMFFQMIRSATDHILDHDAMGKLRSL